MQEVRRFERHLTHPPVDIGALRTKVEDVMGAVDLDDHVHADLAGRLEQIEKHRHMLIRHVEKLHELLSGLGESDGS
jgi:hypothetical protein